MSKHKYLPDECFIKELVTTFLEPSMPEKTVSETFKKVIHIIYNYKTLDVNSHAVRRMLDGIILKMKVNGYQEKALKLNRAAQKLLKNKLLVEKGDLKWGLLSFVLQLGNHPARNDWQEVQKCSPIEQNIDKISNQDENNMKELMMTVSQYSDQDETLSEWSEDEMKSSMIGSEINIELGNCEASLHSNPCYNEKISDSWLKNNSQNYWFDRVDYMKLPEYVISRECLWSLIHPSNGFIFNLSNDGEFTLRSIACFDISQQSLVSILQPVLICLNKMKSINDLIGERSSFDFASSTINSYAGGLILWKNNIMRQLIAIEKLVAKEEKKSIIWLLHELDPIFKSISVVYRINRESFDAQNQRLSSGLQLISVLMQSLDSSLCSNEKETIFELFICAMKHHFRVLESWIGSRNFSSMHLDDFGIYAKDSSLKRKKLEESFYNEIDAIEAIPGLKFLVVIRPTLINIFNLNGIIKSIDASYICEDYIDSIEELVRNKVEQCLIHSTLYKTDAISLKSDVSVSKSFSTTDSLFRNSSNYENDFIFPDEFMKKVFEDDIMNSELNTLAHRSTIVNQIELRSVEYLLTEVLLSLVDTHYENVGREFMHILVDHYKSHDHVNVFKAVMLMEAGDLVREFYTYIFDKVNNKEVLEVLDLTARLQYCLDGRYPDYASNFTVKLRKSPNSHSENGSDWFSTELTSVYIDYEVGWPISLIINDQTVTLYNKLFAFCLNLKRSVSALENLNFKDLGRGATHNSDNDNSTDSFECSALHKRFHRLFLLRHWLLFFARTIHDHFNMNIILSLSQKIDSLWDDNLNPLQFLKDHVDSLKYTCQQCFLLEENKSPIQRAIEGAFSIIEEVLHLWHGSAHRITDSKLLELEDLYATCHRCLTRLLAYISEKQSIPYVQALMDTLGNSFPM